MNCNLLIFPNPRFDKKKFEELKEDIIYIPTKTINQESNNKIQNSLLSSPLNNSIPCLYNRSSQNSNKCSILLYLHGNAEDILTSKEITDYLKKFL
jgi:hypothetical protein